LFGGALGTVASKVGSKFAGKSASEIDEAIAKGEIDYKDLEFVAKQGQVKKPTAKPKDTPEFKEDIPSEEWLNEKIEKAVDMGTNDVGSPELGSVTGSFKEGKPIRLDLKTTKDLEGYNGEHLRLNKEKVNKLAKELEADGKFKEQPLIGVAYNGKPYIIEGNHRIAASQQAGIPIDIEVKYFDGGQRKAIDGWKPDQIREAPATPKDTPEVSTTDTRGQGQQYHGSSQKIDEFLTDENYLSEGNIYGEGFYTTEALDVAEGYTKKGSGKKPSLYRVDEKSPVNFLDIDTFKFKDLNLPRLSDEFQEIIDEFGDNATVRDVFDELRGATDDYGNKLPTYEIIDGAFFPINDKIKEMGYGGIEHVGGKTFNKAPHKVKIYLNPKEQIELKPVTKPEAPATTATPKVEPSPTLEGIIRPDIEQITARVQSENAAAELVKARSIAAKEQGTLGAILASIVPSKYVGAKANQATIDFKRSITEAEELGSRIADKVKREVGENADLNATINKVIDGDASVDISELPASVSSDIIKFQEMRLGLQNKMAQLLDDGAFNSLDDAAKDELMKTVQDSIAGKSYARREYQMFLNRDYKPTQAQYDAALAELSKSMGAAKAKKHMDALENASAARKSADPRGTFGAAVDGVLKRKHTVGKAEREWLGEVVDAPERMRGTLSGLARSVARAETDMVVANELLEAGLGSRTRTGNMVPLTLRGTGGDGTGVYVNPETQVALNQIYLPSADKGTENIFLKGIQDLYGASVAGSKASKVLLNTIAYPVQLYGNTANLLGMGINPFKGAGRGTQLALAEFGGIERLSKSPKARKAMLDDLQDMARYGIKSANVLESDIRSGLKEGFFSKALGKVTDPLGKAYSVPDTMGRYVGWKANQNTIRKIFPQLNDEQVKRQAAIMINDTYQNYDKLSNTVRTLSRWGVMPQFASFTAEFMRNQYNQGKIIAQMAAGKYGQEFGLEASDAGVRAMRKEAAKRTASLLAVYGGTYGAIEGVKAASGVDQEKEEAIREAYPDWNKNRNLMVKLDKNGRTGWTANPSYVVPHSLGLSALKAGMSGQDQASLVGLLADEMIGEGSFVMQEAYRAISNQDRYGRPITNEPDDLKAAADKMTFFITELFKPGFSRELQKATKAARGKGDLTLREVGARQLGARLNPMDLNKEFKNKFMDLNELSKGATGEYRSLLRRDEATEGERQAAYQKANRISREVFNSFVRKDRAMKTLGFSDEERVKTMKEAKVGGKTILQILDNEYKDLSPVLAQTSTDIYEELPEGKGEKRKAILGIIRTKPEMGKRLLSMWKREQKQQRRGLSERELVFSKLGTEDKVSYLKKRPNLVIEYRRKGLLNETVLRALRQ